MRRIITAFIFCFLCGECFSQAGEWVWIKGDSIPNQPGNYGVQGVPSPTNNPPSLYEPCEWTDLNGNFWLFGGKNANNVYGDIWKYNSILNEWTWMKGSGILNDPGSYGIQGITSLSNNPPARSFGSPSWVDTLGNLWMFGGSSGGNAFSDLWKYDIATNAWTWMKGPNTLGQLGNYGIQGIPDPLNYPRCRSECAAAWINNSNELFLFGGYGDGMACTNDLWRYNIASNQWTWMKGSQLINQAGVYGTLGIENPLNTPGSRGTYSHWKDNSGNFWLFAGYYFPSGQAFNDIWRYNPSTNNWTWIGGNDTSNSIGFYGIKCGVSVLNIPQSRYENRAIWTDSQGGFWTFGGVHINATNNLMNDLWKYCPTSNQWIWESGDSIANSSGSWGILGVSNSTNKPNGRFGSVGWSDHNAHLFLFGGASNPWPKMHNDLWKFTIDTTCGVCPSPNSIQENNFTNELLVFPNPTNSSLTISFSSSENQNIELRIYNTLGKQIYFTKEEITKGKFEKEINVGKWSDGIYFLQVKMGEGVVSKKVVIQH